MSLKQELNDLIQRKGYVSIDEVHAFAKDLGHKEATAERELRQSRSPNIKKVTRDNGTIKGYKWYNHVDNSEAVARINVLSEEMRLQKVDNKQSSLL